MGVGEALYVPACESRANAGDAGATIESNAPSRALCRLRTVNADTIGCGTLGAAGHVSTCDLSLQKALAARSSRKECC
jgi:hypothetical protein